MAVYMKTKNDTTYFSTLEGTPDKAKLDALEKLIGTLDHETIESTRERLLAEAQDGEPQKATMDVLTTVTKTYGVLSPMARESMDARQATAVAVLNQKPADLTAEDRAETNEKKKYADALDKHIALVRKAADTSWAILRGWCDEVDPQTKKKTGKYLVETPVLLALDKKVADVQAEAARKTAIAAANKNK